MLSKELQEDIAKIIIKDYEGVKTKSDLEETVAMQQLLYGRHVDLVLEELGQKVEGKNILDVGCGFGGTVLELNELHAKAYGLDVDKEKVKIANKIAKQKKLKTRLWFLVAKAFLFGATFLMWLSAFMFWNTLATHIKYF